MKPKIRNLIKEVQKLKLPKDKKVTIKNFNYSHTSLDALHAQIKPILLKHDVISNYVMDGTIISLCLDGEPVSSLDMELMKGGTMNPAQHTGASITYARRYLLVAYFDLLADDDVDAQTPEELKERTPQKAYTLLKGEKNGKAYEGLRNNKTNKVHWKGQPGYDKLYSEVKEQL
jgi:hypothetical protein